IIFDKEPLYSIPDNFKIIIDNNQVDWKAIEKESTQILQDLIQIPTVRKDESKVAFYLQKFLTKEGIQTRLIPHPTRPDKVSLIAEMGPQDSENGVILLSHSDV